MHLTHNSGRGSDNQAGYVLVTVLTILLVASLAIAAAVRVTSASLRSATAANVTARQRASVEDRRNAGVQWLRTHSTGLALAFSRGNFYTNFIRTTPHAAGGDPLSIPTSVKLRNGSQSVVLSSSPQLGSSSFPDTTDLADGSSFNPRSTFITAAAGDPLVRITLIDAVALDATRDFGDPALGAAPPQTDFAPIYRIDALESPTSGQHLSSYIQAALRYDYGIGFYGRNSIELRQSCDSYLSNSGPYSSSSRRSHCAIASGGSTSIHGSEAVYGTVRTGSLTETSPFGGSICSDFGSCSHDATCRSDRNQDCSLGSLPTYSTWSTYCPSNQGSLTLNTNSTLTVAGNLPSQRCWSNITIRPNTTLTVRSTDYPYFIDTLNIANSGHLNFSPNPATGTINLYVRKIVGDVFNGNQVFNTNNKPYQLRIHYLGTDDLTMNGSAKISGFLIAPYAKVTLSGSFDYSGGIKARDLLLTGSGELHYDESGDITTISDVSYRVLNDQQRYR